jgi:DNA polymerase-3 subunit epsilon
MTISHESMVEELEQSGQYRVLRKLRPGANVCADNPGQKSVGIVLDVETTGLDTRNDEIIELGMVKFAFSPQGALYEILGSFSAFQQPSKPIPAEITELTGITDEMVAGQSISAEAVANFVADASLIIAHNARFDRRMVERFWPEFVTKAWGCSASQVNWRAEGLAGSRLGYLLSDLGYFHNAHRAVDDCHAVIHVLTSPLPRTGKHGLDYLLQASAKPTMRIWAERAPFEQKDVLKARGYRWSDGSGGTRRAWWIDVPAEKYGDELAYLHTDIFGYEANLPVREISCYDRFSERA